MEILFNSYNDDLNKLNFNLIKNLKDIIDIKDKKINTQLNEIDELTKQLAIIKDKCLNLTEECENYQKVSIVKNLHNQIFEKDNLINILQKKLTKIEKNNISLTIEESISNKDGEEVDGEEVDGEEVDGEDVDGEEVDGEEVDGEDVDGDGEEVDGEDVDGEEVEVDGEEVDGEDVEEVYFFEKRLKPPNKTVRLKYLITDDESKDIYEILDNGEPGNHVGKLVGKQNKPFFFK